MILINVVHVCHIETYLVFDEIRSAYFFADAQLFVSVFDHRKLSLTTMRRQTDVEFNLLVHTYRSNAFKSFKY